MKTLLPNFTPPVPDMTLLKALGMLRPNRQVIPFGIPSQLNQSIGVPQVPETDVNIPDIVIPPMENIEIPPMESMPNIRKSVTTGLGTMPSPLEDVDQEDLEMIERIRNERNKGDLLIEPPPKQKPGFTLTPPEYRPIVDPINNDQTETDTADREPKDEWGNPIVDGMPSPGNPSIVTSIAPGYKEKFRKWGEQNPEYKDIVDQALGFQGVLESDPEKYNYNQDKPFFEKNQEYGKSVDPDTICQKSEGCDKAVNYLKKELGNKYDSSMAFDVMSRAKSRGLNSPCQNCYVYSGRAKSGTAMQKPYVEGVGGYKGEITRIKEGEKRKYLADALRNQSSTDFKPTHIPGQIAQKLQSIKAGIPQGAYSKEPDYAEIFAPAGEYINASIGRGTDSMNRTVAEELRKKHKTVGTTYIGYTDDEIRREMRNPNVDHVIPNHISGQPIESIRTSLKDPNAQDYTRDQNETVLIDKKTGKVVPVSVKNIGDWNRVKSMIESGKYQRAKGTTKKLVKSGGSIEGIEISTHGGDRKKYLEEASKRGVIPKYPQFLDEESYMKLIGPEYGKHPIVGGEFPYKVATPTFNMERAGQVMDKWKAEPKKDLSEYMKIAKQIAKRNSKGTKEYSSAPTGEGGCGEYYGQRRRL